MFLPKEDQARRSQIAVLQPTVALEAIIHVDEFLFSALTPTKVQYRIQNLPPVKIKQNGNKYKLEKLGWIANGVCKAYVRGRSSRTISRRKYSVPDMYELFMLYVYLYSCECRE